MCVCECVIACVCVNYLRLNKHLIFSACVHSNLLSLNIYKCTMYIFTTYIIGTMCTPTHIHMYLCLYCLFALVFCAFGPVYEQLLSALSFVCLHNSHTGLQNSDARLTERAIECELCTI